MQYQALPRLLKFFRLFFKSQKNITFQFATFTDKPAVTSEDTNTGSRVPRGSRVLIVNTLNVLLQYMVLSAKAVLRSVINNGKSALTTAIV